MILYNIRANGPFEYDKLILNIGQLHNAYQKANTIYQNSPLFENLKIVDTMIADCTKKDNLMNRLALIKKAVFE